jgi:hypothetical protein
VTIILNANAARKNARNARLGTRPQRVQLDRGGLARFTRDSSVFFSFLRTSYTDTEWGSYLRQSIEDTNFKDLLDRVFNVEEETA